FLRTINMADAARASFELLMPQTREIVEAYVAGINEYMARETSMLEPVLGAEFMILGHTPEAWEGWQSVLVIKVMGLTLSSNMDHELMRFALARKGFSMDEIEDLMPYGPRDKPPALPNLLELYALEEIETSGKPQPDTDAARFAGFGFDLLTGQSASNNWVISGSRTDTGKPILANDPHLGLTAPSTFHLAHLSWLEDGERRSVIGGIVPGTPFVVVGRNNNVAWGLTTTNLDAQDLFLEKLDVENGQYLTESGWEPLSVSTVTIGKGDTSREVTVFGTRHGPLLPRNYSGIGTYLPESYGFALNWPGLAGDDTTLDALYLNNRARSLNGFVQGGRHTVSPMQSIVVADIRGNIGVGAFARTPKRKAANSVKGRAPVPGWLPDYHWEGFLEFGEMLEIRNPSSGALTTANANFLPDDYDQHITYDWAEHFRQARAEELVLKRAEPHTMQSSIEMIGDAYSPAMVEFRDLAARIMQDGVGPHADIQNALAKWNGEMLADRPEPLIMLAWFRHLNIQMLKDDTGELFRRFETGRITPLLAMLRQSGSRDWCDNAISPETETCSDILSTALGLAIDELSVPYGDDWREWKYGAAHVAYNEHRPFGQVGALADFFNIEVPASGGPYTLLRGQTRFEKGQPYKSRHGAAFRAIYDLSDLDKSVFIQSTGQSGHFLSPHYANFSVRWANVEFLPMTTKRDEFLKGSVGTWTLEPK
ncbi:MAG: penicillin acylase family protein, partial [Pseudomonadota bacterium]